MSFVKIHGEILDSSVWGLPHATRIVWVTMLAMADENGVVSASVDGLARRAIVSLKECEAALKCFLGPDQHSRDGTTGERIEKVPGGWLVLNHAQYRDRRTRAQILTAARVRRHREKLATTGPGNDVTPHLPISPSEADAEADAEAEDTEKAAHDAPRRRSPGAAQPLPASTAAEALKEGAWLEREPGAPWASLVAAWTALLGSVERVATEVRKATSWMAQQPEKARRLKSARRFLGNWMRRAADAGTVTSTSPVEEYPGQAAIRADVLQKMRAVAEADRKAGR